MSSSLHIAAYFFVLASLGFSSPLQAHDADTQTEKPTPTVHPDVHDAAAFAPWDAGDQRSVIRQGVKGKDRVQHPFVGEADHIPGSGGVPLFFVDPDVPEMALENYNAPNRNLSSNPLYLASLFYSQILTHIDGPRCNHTPTCSRFAAQAVGKHGAVGILMGLDRLLQTNLSSSVRYLPEIDTAAGPRFFDPVENYEFWHTEQFTGFPAATSEIPLIFPNLQLSSALFPVDIVPTPTESPAIIADQP